MKEAVNKLKRIKNKIEIMPDNKEKAILIANYFKLRAFLVDSKQIDDGDLEYFLHTDVSDYVKMENKEYVNYVNDLKKNIKNLNRILINLRNTYCEGNFNKDKKRKAISRKKALFLIEKFFKTLGSDVYEWYKNFNQENINYSFDNTFDTDGCSYLMLGEKYSYINVCNNSNNLQGYISLVHEYGHAYHEYLTRNNVNLTIYNINVEVMSLLFEKLFIKFLGDSYDYRVDINSVWYDYHYEHFWIVMDTIITSFLLKDGKISSIDAFLNCKAGCSDEMVYTYQDALGCVSDNYPNLSLEGYFYIMGNIISDYFLNLMEFDFEKGFKCACNFIQESSLYSIKEIIDKYASDLSYTKNSIKSVIENGKGYQKVKR